MEVLLILAGAVGGIFIGWSLRDRRGPLALLVRLAVLARALGDRVTAPQLVQGACLDLALGRVEQQLVDVVRHLALTVELEQVLVPHHHDQSP